MATKTSAQNNTNNENKEVKLEELDFDALLKEEAELKARAEAIAKAKQARAESMKNQAFTEISDAIKKYFGTVLNQGELTDYFEAQGFIAKAQIVTPTGKQGRRAIAEDDVLFAAEYKGKTGRNMNFKMDAATDKMTGGAKDFFTTLKDMSFEELKPKFTAKFWQFAQTPEGQEWYKKHFSYIAEDIDAALKGTDEAPAAAEEKQAA